MISFWISNQATIIQHDQNTYGMTG